MKTKIIVMAIIIITITACNNKKTISNLKVGEKITIQDQQICDGFINEKNTIIIDGEIYTIKRKRSNTASNFTGSREYIVKKKERVYSVGIITNENTMIPLSAIVERKQ